MELKEMYRNQVFGARWGVYWAALCALVLASFYGFCIQDDAFISFRYAENWVDGHGLVFNPGERVEGYTNLSWTALIASLYWLGADSAMSALLLGYASILFLVGATAFLAKTLQAPPWLAAFLIAVDASVLLEGVQGLETVFFAGLCTLALALMMTETRQAKAHYGSTIVFIVAAFTRPETPLVFGLCHLSNLISNGRSRLRPTVMAGVALFAALALLTLWRWLYYGDFIPNTARAKVGGIAIERGLIYWVFHLKSHPLLWAGVGYGLWAFRKNKSLLPALACVFGYGFYVIAVGGDFKLTSRFFLPVTGMLAVCAALSLHRLAGRQKWVSTVIAIAAIAVYGWHFERSLNWAKIRRQNWDARRAAGLWIQNNTPSDTVLAVRSVGVLPYYAKKRTIDMWGLTNRTIATTPVENFGQGMAGHERQNHAYVFGLSPDIYIPEDDVIGLEAVQQPLENGFPTDFTARYSPVSIQLGASWFNIWVRNGFPQDKMGSVP